MPRLHIATTLPQLSHMSAAPAVTPHTTRRIFCPGGEPTTSNLTPDATIHPLHSANTYCTPEYVSSYSKTHPQLSGGGRTPQRRLRIGTQHSRTGLNTCCQTPHALPVRLQGLQGW